MLRVIVKVGQAHAKQKPWSLVRDFTGGSEAGNSKSCWKSGFKGSCVADCPEFDTSRGAPGPSRIREADPRGRGVRSSKVKCRG